MDTEEINAARQIRSQCYFYLCRVWGVKPDLRGAERYITHLIFHERPEPIRKAP